MSTPAAHPAMEPDLVTATVHLAALEELRRRELVFHRPEFGTTRADFEHMTDEAFREVGASGRRYSRAYVLAVLERRGLDPPQEDWEAYDFHCAEIAADNYLVTYSLRRGDRLMRRASIWRRAGADWKIVFHQGTVVVDSSPSASPSV